MSWLIAHWDTILYVISLLLLVSSAINAATKHYSESSGKFKIVGAIIEFLSFIASRGDTNLYGGKLKIPFSLQETFPTTTAPKDDGNEDGLIDGGSMIVSLISATIVTVSVIGLMHIFGCSVLSRFNVLDEVKSVQQQAVQAKQSAKGWCDDVVDYCIHKHTNPCLELVVCQAWMTHMYAEIEDVVSLSKSAAESAKAGKYNDALDYLVLAKAKLSQLGIAIKHPPEYKQDAAPDAAKD